MPYETYLFDEQQGKINQGTRQKYNANTQFKSKFISAK